MDKRILSITKIMKGKCPACGKPARLKIQKTENWVKIFHLYGDVIPCKTFKRVDDANKTK